MNQFFVIRHRLKFVNNSELIDFALDLWKILFLISFNEFCSVRAIEEEFKLSPFAPGAFNPAFVFPRNRIDFAFF